MNMTNRSYSIIESNYRASYGKLFSALISQFGVSYINEIEDAIQNSFLKSLKNWKADQIPDNKQNWLYIVARNDVINQIKAKNKTIPELAFSENSENETSENDLRLQSILFVVSSKNISSQTKVIFVLKNIFGLHMREIAESTLLKQDAIYKRIKRANKSLQLEFKNKPIDVILKKVNSNEISIVEEILYAVFNIGFDSFDEKIKSIINEDLCLEALSLSKLLYIEYGHDSTRNLLSLFCFHIARIPSKVSEGKLIPFFQQDRNYWNKKLIELGFHYLQKPAKLDKFYVESLIVSKYMTTNSFNTAHWDEIVKLYELLMKFSNSAIIRLNFCYVLHKAQRTEEALELLEKIKHEMPKEHIYLSLVEAEILKEAKPKESGKIMFSVLNKINQSIRKEYLLENGFINL